MAESMATNLYGTRSGSAKTCASLLRDVLNVRFGRGPGDGPNTLWYVAHSPEREETLVLVPNLLTDGEMMEPRALGYETLFYIRQTKRIEEISRLLASQTRFRFLDSSERVRSTIETVLSTTLDQ